EFLETVNGKILDANGSASSAVDFVALTERAISANYELYDASLTNLDSLLQKRVDRIPRNEMLIVLFVLVSISAAIFVWRRSNRHLTLIAATAAASARESEREDLQLLQPASGVAGVFSNAFNKVVDTLQKERLKAKEDHETASGAERII